MDGSNYLTKHMSGGDDGFEGDQALSGFIAASDQHAATPNATLIGNRARMRWVRNRFTVRVVMPVALHSSETGPE